MKNEDTMTEEGTINHQHGTAHEGERQKDRKKSEVSQNEVQVRHG